MKVRLAAVIALLASLPLRAQSPSALLSGPMPAYADLRETAIWLQTTHAVRAQVRFHPEGRPAEARVSEAVTTRDATFPLKDVSLTVFKRYWPGLAYGLRDTPGVFQRFAWNDVDFFLLDDRYHRMPDRWPDGPDKTMLGRAQLDWLKASLVSSRAAFKVIAVGSQALNPHTRFEGWLDYPAEQTELLDFIRDRRVEGVIFLSGDRHATELIKLERPGAYALYDYTSSPLTAGPRVIRDDDPEKNNPSRVPGTLLTEHTFGMLRFEGPPGDRRVRLQAYDKAGAMKWEHVIRRDEVSFPRAPEPAH